MQTNKKSPALGGIGLGIFVFFTLAWLCANGVHIGGSGFLAILAIFGLCLMVYALVTGRTKFMG